VLWNPNTAEVAAHPAEGNSLDDSELDTATGENWSVS